MSIKVGIIGYGRIGAEHSQWLAAATGIRAAAVYDPTAARQELARAGGLTIHNTINAMLLDPALDAVLVSTPTAMHFDDALAALAAGKHVMVEKPMALNFAQSRQLVEEATKQNCVLSVFHNRRWDADYLTVQAALAAGQFGKLINIESRLGQWSSCVGPAAIQWRPQWRNEAAFGGGGLFDWGSHFVDQLLQLMLPDNPIRVFAQLRGNVWTQDCDDFARVVIDFQGGAAGLVEINTTTTRPLPRWHIDGTSGSGESPFSLEYDTNRWSKLSFTPAEGGATSELPRAAVGMNGTQIWERFAAACRGEGEPAVTAQSVLPTMRVLDAARASAREGCSVDLR